MPYQGVAFAIIVGLGLATAAIMYFLAEQQNQREQPHRSYQGTPYNYDEDFPPNSRARPTDESEDRRRRSRSVRNKRNGGSVMCAICHEETASQIRKLPCGHSYHTICIDQWATVKRDCPCCRKEF